MAGTQTATALSQKQNRAIQMQQAASTAAATTAAKHFTRAKSFIHEKSIDNADAFFVAGQVAQFWNTLEPSLLLMYQKLEELGFSYDNNKVTYIEVLPEVRDVRPL